MFEMEDFTMQEEEIILMKYYDMPLVDTLYRSLKPLYKMLIDTSNKGSHSKNIKTEPSIDIMRKEMVKMLLQKRMVILKHHVHGHLGFDDIDVTV